MRKRFAKTSRTRRERGAKGHRFEHWYVDHQVYFITARCRDRHPAFADERAKAIFWDRFDHYTAQARFEPWVVSLLDNHYHILGYNAAADGLKVMMQRFHGSVAKLVNDLLPERRSDFWRDKLGREFFDGCIRDAKQAERSWRYTRDQSVRHGLRERWEDYPHTRVYGEADRLIAWARGAEAFMEDVPYRRYARRR